MSGQHTTSVVLPPQAQGLYDPRYEHDACGMGFVVNIKGQKTHLLVQQALNILLNLDHRGAVGSDPHSGDGAGILLQIPDKFLRDACDTLNITLPPVGAYGVGMVFLPPDSAQRAALEGQIEAIVAQEGQQLLGWRTVATNGHSLGGAAKASQPVVRQFFVAASPALRSSADELAFERQLYIIRRRSENAVRQTTPPGSAYFHIASLSSRTIVYKGMLQPAQVNKFYLDLFDLRVESAICLVHSRFSTNTFPSWARAHPYRYMIHNGEINTLRGNVNWMRARESLLESAHFDGRLSDLFPIIDGDGSDSAMFDNVLEFLYLNGTPLAKTVMMMIPEPWQKHEQMSASKKAFYEYHACMMEPWDGPAAIAFTDGARVGAVLDRNGLRPARYYVTKNDHVIMASEVGVLDIPPENIVAKGRLQPGRMLLIDTDVQRIIADDEIKEGYAAEKPYQQWLDDHLRSLDALPLPAPAEPAAGSVALPIDAPLPLTQLQLAFGYTFEDLRWLLVPMIEKGAEALGSMGDDTPPAALSDKSRLLYDYFKQLFAQVTNPPIDAIREALITATETYLGTDGNMLQPTPDVARRIKLAHPILTNDQLAKLRHIATPGFQSAEIPTLYDPTGGGAAIEQGLDQMFSAADSAIAAGANLLILTDRGVNRQRAALPALLATSALHHHLIRRGTRVQVSLIVESAEPREVHHFATLLGYGAEAINPYLAYATLADIIDKRLVVDEPYAHAEEKYVKAVVKGVVKVLSKMGISTVQSYCGAQIFEALGLQKTLIDKYFTGTASRIEGSDIHTIAREVLERHKRAFPARPANGHVLPPGGKYQVRADSEYHIYNPATVHALQNACRSDDYAAFKRFSQAVNSHEKQFSTLRGLLRLSDSAESIPLTEVEPVEAIVKRFKTGAMSYGSISREAHETLAIAMNRLGGKSNTGEGGEDPGRYVIHYNGDSRKSAIKQVASGRFGVTSEYLVNAEEIQIKMAQGAKPGEGGQLPGHKVYPWIAKVRFSTPGVGLISPPPHHDIYSIEDLAQLIFDLKNANPSARINVKLVSEVGVGTVAAGVAKAHADVILISGASGGTGASPLTSLKNTGLPWELGLAETHQTLLLNNLRSRVRLETDGQLKTGRDVAIAALLGAEEFGFSTAPLISLGCIMMRVCHLNTCPVGIATQNPELRAHFAGDPVHVMRFMRFVAQELREIMAELGFRTVDEMIGRVDKLNTDAAIRHWKVQGIDLTPLLHVPDVGADTPRRQTTHQDHGLENTLDYQVLLDLCEPAIELSKPVVATLPIRNTNRTVGTMVGSVISRRYGEQGLPENSIRLHFQGSAGQSFGAFVPRGMTLTLEGDANDYFGKGLSGGTLAVTPPRKATFAPEENIIIGNVALYGATGGKAYIHGRAGERFGVRNSGVEAVVEGVGDHGCEYMTGGRVVILGTTGRNFAAGMSGGVAYVLDEDGLLHTRVNHEMVSLEPVAAPDEMATLQAIVQRHAAYTGSARAKALLADWAAVLPRFVKVMPRDYKQMLAAIADAHSAGLGGDDALLAAFEATVAAKA